MHVEATGLFALGQGVLCLVLAVELNGLPVLNGAVVKHEVVLASMRPACWIEHCESALLTAVSFYRLGASGVS